MAYLWFILDSIPDLSLGKYSSLDENGVDGVLKKTGSFLRQLNRKGMSPTSKGMEPTVFFHLFYIYDPKEDNGKRLKVYFAASGKKEKLKHTRKLIQNSAISAFYDIVSIERVLISDVQEDKQGKLFVKLKNHLDHIEDRLYISQDSNALSKEIINKYKNEYCTAKIKDGKIISLEDDFHISDSERSPGLLNDAQRKFKRMVALGKREYSVQPSVVSIDSDEEYYKVAEWEMNDDARLYNMFKLMQGLDKPAAFRVDVFSIDYTDDLRDVLPIKELRDKTNILVTKHASSITANRDENAEDTLRQYNDLIEDYESSPHFRANILAFADEEDIAELIVDAAGAEALKSGSYSVKSFLPKDFNGELNVCSSMDVPINVAGKKVADKLKFMPNFYLLNELRSFFAFPALHDGEAIEIPKETAPKSPNDKDKQLILGVDENNYDVFFPLKLIKKHAFLAGVPGSGKTNTMLHFATELWNTHKIPFLILEPAKKEYRALARLNGMEELLIFSPSSGTNFPLHINPFEFPFGMSLSEHIRNLMSVFEGAFSLAGSAPFLIDSAIEAVYRNKGWYPDTINKEGLNLKYPTISELYKKLAEEVESTEYEGEIKGNLKSFLQVRLGSLLRREMGDLFDVPESTVPPDKWLEKPALIELEAMGSGPANFLTLLLSTLIRESLKVVKPSDDGKKDLRHVIFFEEAHNLIGPEAKEVTGENADPKLAATAYIVKMLAEVRALNEGIIIADQLPTAMASEVIKNTGLKIAHRLTAEDDRNLLGGTMSANSTQLEQMATFEVGNALVTFEGLLRPFKLKMSKWQKDNSMYDPLTNEELLKLLTESEKPGYDYLLKRSSEICCMKFEAEQHKIKCDAYKLMNSYIKWDNFLKYDEVFNNLKNEADDKHGLVNIIEKKWHKNENLNIEFEKLYSKLKILLSSIENLWIKERGYFRQNPIYKSKISGIMEELIKCWNDLFNRLVKEKLDKEIFQNCHSVKALIENYENFSSEINKSFMEHL